MATGTEAGPADFVAFLEFGGFSDYLVGGAFSGRLTAGLVAAGVMLLSAAGLPLGPSDGHGHARLLGHVA